MVDSPYSYQSCGKRNRPNDEVVLAKTDATDGAPNSKILRRPEQETAASADSHSANCLPSLAPSLEKFLEPGGSVKYLPRPEWYVDPSSTKGQKANCGKPPSSDADFSTEGELPNAHFRFVLEHPESEFTFLPISENALSAEAEVTNDQKNIKAAVFGKDMDHALHVAIREHSTQSALMLLDYGAPVDAENAKRATPLIIAAQKGNVTLVRELLGKGANVAAATLTGLTAILQAAHFGKTDVLKILLQSCSTHLIECANYNQTTPLMRASQEGHVETVQLLLEAGAQVNRRNRSNLTALMLASQRGHAQVVQILIKHGEVARVLVTSGCELSVRDSRGRTAQEIAVHKHQKGLVDLLDPAVQVGLMRKRARHLRNFEIIRFWHLFHQERATIPLFDCGALGIHEVNSFFNKQFLPYPFNNSSTQALLRTMALPEPLVRMIAQFTPSPLIWEKRIKLLTSRTSVSPDDAVSECLDLIDEILDEGGFPEACDDAGVPLPTGLEFNSWTAWKSWGHQKGVAEASDAPRSLQRTYLSTAQCPAPYDCNRPTFVEWRRYACFLQVLAREHSSKLGPVLTTAPYKMPSFLINKLVRVSDAASLVRRMRSGVHFDMHVAMDLVMLASQLYSWYWRERYEKL